MLEYIKGRLIEAFPTKISLETNGLGYLIFIPLSSFGKLPQIGSELLVYVSLVIREDSHRLFGFLSKDERNLFETLCEISGVGPKTALSILGHMPIHELQSALSREDVQRMIKIPGIGKKTAERLVLELRDKYKNILTEISVDESSQKILTDATSALVHLGYQPKEAERLASRVYEQAERKPNLSQLITLILKSKT